MRLPCWPCGIASTKGGGEPNEETCNKNKGLRNMTKVVADIANEVCHMTRLRRGATIIFDVSRRPSDDLVLMHMTQHGTPTEASEPLPPFTSGQLLRAFDTRRKGHDGALVLRFFKSSDAFEVSICARGVMLPIVDDPIVPRVSLQDRGCRYLSALTMSALTNMAIVVVSHEEGTMTIMRRAEIVREFSLKELSEAAAFMTAYLRLMLTSQAEGETADAERLTLAEWHVTTRAEVKPFDVTGTPAYREWYFFYFVETTMQVYQTPLNAASDYKVPLNTFACACFGDEYGADDLAALTSEANHARLRAMMRRNAEESLAIIQSGSLNCCVLEYGGKRLGGFFFKLDRAKSEVRLEGIFMPRALYQTDYAMRAVAGFCKWICNDQGYNRLSVRYLAHAVTAILPCLEAFKKSKARRASCAITPVLSPSLCAIMLLNAKKCTLIDLL